MKPLHATAALSAAILLSACGTFSGHREIQISAPPPLPPPLIPAECTRTPEVRPSVVLRPEYPARELARSDAVIDDASETINNLAAAYDREATRTVACRDGLAGQTPAG